MQLNTLQPTTKTKRTKRVGRGGVRGKTSGKGHKGQNSRAGTSKRPEWRDIIKKLPKLRGHGKNRGRTVNPENQQFAPVTFTALNEMFEAGDVVNPSSLVQKGVVRRYRGRAPLVKVLAKGELTKKLTFVNCAFSEQAKAAVEKAGGTIE